MIRALLLAPLLALVFVATTLAQNASVLAGPAVAPAGDWTGLLTPLVIALIPALVALAKPMIPERYKVLYPLLATALGPLGDLVLSFAQSRAADPKWGLMMGLSAVAVREIVDQLRKIPTGPVVAKAIALALLLPALSGCAFLPAMYVKCSGKGAITGTAALGGGLLYGGGGTNTGTLQADCGDGFEYYRGPRPKSMPAEPSSTE